MTPIRLGVVGAGLIWNNAHKPILETLTDVIEPIAFCELSAERRAEVADAFPNATVLNDLDSLLKLPEVEVVLVLTPIASNAPTAQAALEAGKHVIMEKPIARSVAEGRDLVATARRLGRRLFITEQLAYRHAEDQVSEIIAAGEIGDLVMWDQVLHMSGPVLPRTYAATLWRKQADYPLGDLFDGGIHLIASLSKVFGVPETVFASGRKLRPEYGDYDHVAMMFQYSGGPVGMLSHSTCLSPSQNHFHIHGTRGTIAFEPARIVVERPDQPSRIVDLPAENAYAAMWRALGEAYQQQREPYYTAEKALGDVAILEAVDRSLKTGAKVPIAEPGSPPAQY